MAINSNEILTKIRNSRNKLLAETDWMASSDVTMPTKVATYRQALRDLPQTANLHYVVFPAKPIGPSYTDIEDPYNPMFPPISWTLNEDTCLYEPPVAMPDDGKSYTWDEVTTNWKEIT